MWYLILLVATSDSIRGIDVLFLIKYGLVSKARFRHLSWNNSDNSATLSIICLFILESAECLDS
jgi:hypothetical protein